MKKLFLGLALLSLSFSAFTAPTPGQNITLAWNSNPEPEVIGYRLFWGFGESRDYPNHVDVTAPNTQATVTLPRPGLTYRFAVIAISDEGLESDYSEEVTYTPPVPAPPQVKVSPDKLEWPHSVWYTDIVETCTDLTAGNWTPLPLAGVRWNVETGNWTLPYTINRDEPQRFFRLRRTLVFPR